MGKKSRNQKKEKQFKTREMRKEEIYIVKKKIEELGLSEQMEGIKEFYKLFEEFKETGESRDGKIKLIGFKRILNYILTNTVGKKCLVNLSYDERV